VIWLIAGLLLAAALVYVPMRANSAALRAVHRSRSRLDRFKLTKKPFIRATLLADEAIAAAVKNTPPKTPWTKQRPGSVSKATSTRSSRSSTSSLTTRSAS
jgi:hypothetical protein